MDKELYFFFQKFQDEILEIEKKLEMSRKENLIEGRVEKVNKFIGIKEASELTGIPEQRLRGIAKSNKDFPAVYCGNRAYIIKDKLNEFFNENIGLVM